jgi:hypothetical protein
MFCVFNGKELQSSRIDGTGEWAAVISLPDLVVRGAGSGAALYRVYPPTRTNHTSRYGSHEAASYEVM